MRVKICRKEAKVSRYGAKLTEINDGDAEKQRQALIQEATELMKIFDSTWRRPNKRLHMSIIHLTVASMLVPVEGPEYETIYAFGGLCEIDSIEETMYLNDICGRLGTDILCQQGTSLHLA